MNLSDPTTQALLGVVLALVGTIYKLYASKQEQIAKELGMRATLDQLKEAKAEAEAALERVRVDCLDRIHSLQSRQDREIEVLTGQVNEIKASLAEMRRESAQGTVQILQRLEILASRTV